MNKSSIKNIYDIHNSQYNEFINNSIGNLYTKSSFLSNMNKCKRLNERGYIVRKTLVEMDLVDTLFFLEDIYKNKKKALKMINKILALEDCGVAETTLGFGERCDTRLRKNYILRDYFKFFNYIQMSNILGFLKEKNYSFHNIVSNLSKFANHNISEENKDTFREEAYNFLVKILSEFSFNNIVLVIGYINYAKVRNAKTLDDMINHINKIGASKRGIIDSKAVPSCMLIKMPYHDDRVFFSKTADEINTIGSRTHCCFRKGGAAESLLKPALYSPIAGILTGNFNGATWFAFVWEIVEYVPELNTFSISLILDNIESSKTLDQYQFDYLVSKLKELNKYYNIYVGYLRNDIPTLPENIKSTLKDRYRRLVAYEKEFARYGSYDDSAKVYTLFNNTPKKEIVIKRMDNGDLHRSKYVEDIVWGENSDNEFLTIKTNQSPSYVIGNDNFIFGYLTTRFHYRLKETGEIFTTKSKRDYIIKESEGKITKEDFDKILYFEDIFVPNNIKLMKCLKLIADDLKEYMELHQIKYYSASFNEYSKPFQKRFKDYEFIHDDRFDISNPLKPVEDYVKKPVNLDFNDYEIINLLKE